VRVDVSPWDDPSAFAVFARGEKLPDASMTLDEDGPIVGGTSV